MREAGPIHQSNEIEQQQRWHLIELACGMYRNQNKADVAANHMGNEPIDRGATTARALYENKHGSHKQ